MTATDQTGPSGLVRPTDRRRSIEASRLPNGERANASAVPVSMESLPPIRRNQLVLQRCLDLCVAAIAGLILLIPGLLIAIAVKVSSRGPIHFTQQRVGVDGEMFELIKFRTMADGTHDEVLRNEKLRKQYRENDFKLSPDDPRITLVGRFLRRTSLDEIPQLFNVVRGRMSIVGVRPLLAEELALRPEYDQALYRRKRPGMTGLWQVTGRSSVQKTDRLHLDREYLEDWTVWDDVKIIFRTPAALLRISHAH